MYIYIYNRGNNILSAGLGWAERRVWAVTNFLSLPEFPWHLLPALPSSAGTRCGPGPYSVIYDTLLYSTILYYTIRYYTRRYDTILYDTILQYNIK